jgi:serine/threonine protein kinase
MFAGDYRIVRPLAAGGMGAVYVVEQVSTGKERALKLMRTELAGDAEALRRFQQEARIGARIESEHVVEIHSAGVDDTTKMPYLVMELLAGENLETRIARAPLTAAEAYPIFQQICHAIGAAHAANVVHRDLKPENVFLARARRAGAAEGEVTVKVLDFGIAKLVAEAKTHNATSGMIGTPFWMAPEQADRGPITATADVWALALIAYYALTGRVFWRSADDPSATYTQLLKEVVMGDIPLPSARAAEHNLAARLPPGFDQVFMRAITRDPRARHPDARAFWAELGPVLARAASLPESAAIPAAPGSAPRSSAAAFDATSHDPQSSRFASHAGAAQQDAAQLPGAGPYRGAAQKVAHAGAPAPKSSSTAMGWGLGLAGLFVLCVLFVGCQAIVAARHRAAERAEAQRKQTIALNSQRRERSTVMPLASAASMPRCRLCTQSVEIVDGPLDRNAIQSSVERAFPSLDGECLTRSRRAVARGTTTMSFVVSEGVAHDRVVEGTTSTDGADQCLVRALSEAQFPVAAEKTTVLYTVRYDPAVK